jgi:hypothetical protein
MTSRDRYSKYDRESSQSSWEFLQKMRADNVTIAQVQFPQFPQQVQQAVFPQQVQQVQQVQQFPQQVQQLVQFPQLVFTQQNFAHSGQFQQSYPTRQITQTQMAQYVYNPYTRSIELIILQ